jgi:AcrR family transcriptional regulator
MALLAPPRRRHEPVARRPGGDAALAPVQARAHATRDALLAAGRALLADRDFDALSIADLAGRAGLSVGSFYGRFRDKEAYIDQLQLQVTTEWVDAATRMFDAQRARGADATAIVRELCATVVRLLRTDAGFLRAALRHTPSAARWTPMKRTGRAVVDMAARLLVGALPHLPAGQRTVRVRFAMQIVYGTVINAVLNDPGPLALDDPKLERELARVMCLYLGIDADRAGAARRSPRGAAGAKRRAHPSPQNHTTASSG